MALLAPNRDFLTSLVDITSGGAAFDFGLNTSVGAGTMGAEDASLVSGFDLATSERDSTDSSPQICVINSLESSSSNSNCSELKSNSESEFSVNCSDKDSEPNISAAASSSKDSWG